MLSSLPFYVFTSIDVVILSLSLCKSIEPPRIALYTTPLQHNIYFFSQKKYLSLSLPLKSPSTVKSQEKQERISKSQRTDETEKNLKL